MKPEWTRLLEDWDQIALAGIARKRRSEELDDEELEIRSLGTSFIPRPSRQELRAATKRLGGTLPNSLLDFFELSDGWCCPGMGVRLVGVTDLHWLRDAPAGRHLAEVYRRVGSTPVSDEAYAVYGPHQSPLAWRPQYLPGALSLVDEEEQIGGTLVLLNPEVTPVPNEWEAWILHPKDGTAYRFPSFLALMESFRDQARSYYEDFR